MKKEELRDMARDLQAIIILGRALAPLRAEKRITVSLSHSEIEVIEYMYLLNKVQLPTSASQLASFLRVDASRISTLLKRVEREKGYVTRRWKEERPHRLLLELTQSGEEIAKQAVEADAKDLQEILKLVGDEGKLKFLRYPLEDIRAAIVNALRSQIGGE